MNTTRVIIIALVVMAMIASVFYLLAARYQNQILIEKEHISAFSGDNKEIITDDQVEHLPGAVKLWLRHSGVIGKENIYQVSLKQKGQMKLKKDQKEWIDAEAVQLFSVEDPAFIWNVEMKMSGIPIKGRDLFIDGQGDMLITAGGVIPIVKASAHPKLHQATLQRYLGEIVWFPTAALMPYISWEEIDELSARATMTVGETSGSAVFYFTPEGDLEKFIAWRYKDINDREPAEWMATVNRTEEVNGIRIPVELEAAWIEETGPFTWYMFEIYDVVYNGAK